MLPVRASPALSMLSFTAVAVTVCAWFQFAGVKVRLVGLSVTMAGAVMSMRTSSVGSLVSTTV